MFPEVLLLALAPGPGAPPGATVPVTAPIPAGPLVADLDLRGQRPAQDGAECLRALPGFGVVRKGGIDGDPVLRGMGGSRVGVLTDGEETPGGCGGRMDPPTAYLFPGAYDRVQVVKGPQTVRHGPGYSAGTVLFRRLPPAWEQPGWTGTAGWTVGGFGRADISLEVQAGSPRWYGRASGLRTSSGDYRSGAGRVVHSSQDRWSLYGALGWTPAPGARVEVRGTRSDGQAAYADRGLDGVRFLRRNLGLVLELRDPGGRWERVEVQAYLNDVDHVMDNITLRSSTGAPGPMARNPRRTTRGVRVEAALAPEAEGEWILGAEALASRHDLRWSRDPWALPVTSRPRAPDALLEDAGLFGEWSRPLGDAHRLVAGARVDRWRARDLRDRPPPGPADRDRTLGAGFVRGEWGRPESGTAAYAGLGHTQRPPDYWELIPLEGQCGTRPERTTQLDLGASRQGRAVRAALSLYLGQVSDFILLQAAGPPGSGLGVRNVQARTWGGEWILAADLGGPLRAEGSLAGAWGENRTDRVPLAQIPPPEARLGLAWETPGWAAGTRVRMVAPQDRYTPGQGGIAGLDLGRTPGFAVFSLDGRWRPAQAEALQFRFGIDNLFDRAYVEHVNRRAVPVPGYPVSSRRIEEPGRLAWVAMAMKLN
ncbi:MAG: TonB-dependent copper receptor [Holophaga sp.]